jgi:hypothetical protein
MKIGDECIVKLGHYDNKPRVAKIVSDCGWAWRVRFLTPSGTRWIDGRTIYRIHKNFITPATLNPTETP